MAGTRPAVDGHDPAAIDAGHRGGAGRDRPAVADRLPDRDRQGCARPRPARPRRTARPWGQRDRGRARGARTGPIRRSRSPSEILAAWRAAGERGQPAYAAWQERHEAARPSSAAAFDGAMAGELPAELGDDGRTPTSASCRPSGRPGPRRKASQMALERADRGGADDGRRLGRPHPLQPHQHRRPPTPMRARRLWRPLRQLRRARARAWSPP